MIQKYALLFLLLLAPVAVGAASISNAGFLQSGIWYSKDPFFASETVRVYAALFNSGTDDISGTVEFFDNKKSLGSRDFFAGRGGTFTQVFTDWQVTAGAHVIEATITKASLLPVGSPPVAVDLERARVEKDSRFVDEDTDKDGIGNGVDTDDDNDGVSDAEEIKKGTDPVTYQTHVREEEKQEKREAPKSETRSSVSDDVLSLFPDTLEEKIISGNSAVERALAPVNDFIDRKTDEAEKELRSIAEDPAVAGKEKLKGSLYLASLGALSFVFGNEIVFYLMALFIGYFLARFIFLRIFRRA